MKKILAITGLAFVVVSGSSFAAIDDRQGNQRDRIKQGIASGELSRGEAHRLAHQQSKIAAQERRFKSDGDFTNGERARVQNRLNHSSANIYRKKHN